MPIFYIVEHNCTTTVVKVEADNIEDIGDGTELTQYFSGISDENINFDDSPTWEVLTEDDYGGENGKEYDYGTVYFKQFNQK